MKLKALLLTLALTVSTAAHTFRIENSVNNTGHQSYLEYKNPKPVARVLTDISKTNKKVEYAVGHSLKTKGLNAKGEVFGFVNNNKYGVGVNARGRIANTFDLGFGLEKSDKDVQFVYARKDFKDLKLTLGLIESDATKGYAGLSALLGRFYTAAAITASKKGFNLTAVYGKLKNGEGIYYKASAGLDNKKNYFTHFLLGTKPKQLGMGGLKAVVDIEDGIHDPGIMRNYLDFIDYDWNLVALGGVYFNLGFKEKNKTKIFNGQVVYRFQGKLSPMLGVKYNLSKKQSGEGLVGATYKDHYLFYTINISDKKPQHKVTFGVLL